MTIIYEERSSDSPYIETVTQGRTVSDGGSIRPAESRWHMVFVAEQGNFHPLIVGPLPTARAVSWQEGAEILWIKFKPGVFMPHLPFRHLLDKEVALPAAVGRSFWLKSSTWQFPTYENTETFIDKLVYEEVLVSDPVVNVALQDQLPPRAMSDRTVRHRFLQATGLSQSAIRQMQRAQQAAALLRQGVSILDAVDELGYFDHPHLTRSLKRFVGYTPAQIVHAPPPE